jgi:excisionase family DNA binding protein
LLDVYDVAKQLNVAKDTVYRWSRRGVLPSVRMPGNVVRWRPKDIEKFMAERVMGKLRDNVLYEFGLFSGKFGRHRTHLMIPDSPDSHIPSDILGVKCVRYTDVRVSSDGSVPSVELDAACVELRKEMRTGLQNKPLKERPGRRLLKFLT